MSRRAILDRALLAIALVVLVVLSQQIGIGSESQWGSSLRTKDLIEAIVPPDGYCYHAVSIDFPTSWDPGFYVPGFIRTELNKFYALVGKRVYLYTHPWGNSWTPGEVLWEINPRPIPGVYPSGDQNHKVLLDEGLFKALGCVIFPVKRVWWTDPDWQKKMYADDQTIKGIAQGLDDDLIIEQAQIIKEFGYPLYIRFGSEMNIHQGTGAFAVQYAFGRNPSDFVAAWRHYVDMLRAQGADNAIFVWNLNCIDIGPHHWTEYYPGDDYVDWVGVDFYQYDPRCLPEDMIRGIYNDYKDRKPIMVCEWGANWEAQNYPDYVRAGFVEQFFDSVEAKPKVKMINYWYTGGVVGGFKFDASTTPLTAYEYANRIENSRYITALP
jgi:hypothetical protein